MVTKEDVLFKILTAALWGRRMPPGLRLSHPQFEVLSHLAEKQTVKGLLYDGIAENEVQLEKMDAIHLYSERGIIGEDSDAINRELRDVCQLLTVSGASFLIVKGQTIARYYRHPKMRTLGDIDIWCTDEESYQRARKALQQAWNIEIADDGGSELEFEHGDHVIDLQRTLVEMADRGNLRYWDTLVKDLATVTDQVEVNGITVPTLEPTLNLLYTFLHLYHHFIEMGIGLRHICDMAVLLHAYRDRLDRKRLQEMLEAMDYMTAFKAFGAICVDKLGLPAEEFPFEITSRDRSFMPRILKLVYQRGNFGKYGHHHGVRSGIGYYLEAFWMKIGHYRTFYQLSPKEVRASVFLWIPQRMMEAVKRHLG